jgi:hypothetical protein
LISYFEGVTRRRRRRKKREPIDDFILKMEFRKTAIINKMKLKGK